MGLLCVRIKNFRKEPALRIAHAANSSHKRSVSLSCSTPFTTGFDGPSTGPAFGNSDGEMTGLSRDGLKKQSRSRGSTGQFDASPWHAVSPMRTAITANLNKESVLTPAKLIWACLPRVLLGHTIQPLQDIRSKHHLQRTRKLGQNNVPKPSQNHDRCVPFV